MPCLATIHNYGSDEKITTTNPCMYNLYSQRKAEVSKIINTVMVSLGKCFT